MGTFVFNAQIKRLFLLFVLAAGLLGAAEPFNGQCRTDAGPVSSMCTVTVFDGGTLNLSAIFSDFGLVTPVGNPFSSNNDGRFVFYAADGVYDV